MIMAIMTIIVIIIIMKAAVTMATLRQNRAIRDHDIFFDEELAGSSWICFFILSSTHPDSL